MPHKVTNNSLRAHRRRQKIATINNGSIHKTGGSISCLRNCFRTNMGDDLQQDSSQRSKRQEPATAVRLHSASGCFSGAASAKAASAMQFFSILTMLG